MPPFKRGLIKRNKTSDSTKSKRKRKIESFDSETDSATSPESSAKTKKIKSKRKIRATEEFYNIPNTPEEIHEPKTTKKITKVERQLLPKINDISDDNLDGIKQRSKRLKKQNAVTAIKSPIMQTRRSGRISKTNEVSDFSEIQTEFKNLHKLSSDKNTALDQIDEKVLRGRRISIARKSISTSNKTIDSNDFHHCTESMQEILNPNNYNSTNSVDNNRLTFDIVSVTNKQREGKTMDASENNKIENVSPHKDNEGILENADFEKSRTDKNNLEDITLNDKSPMDDKQSAEKTINILNETTVTDNKSNSNSVSPENQKEIIQNEENKSQNLKEISSSNNEKKDKTLENERVSLLTCLIDQETFPSHMAQELLSSTRVSDFSHDDKSKEIRTHEESEEKDHQLKLKTPSEKPESNTTENKNESFTPLSDTDISEDKFQSFENSIPVNEAQSANNQLDEGKNKSNSETITFDSIKSNDEKKVALIQESQSFSKNTPAKTPNITPIIKRAISFSKSEPRLKYQSTKIEIRSTYELETSSRENSTNRRNTNENKPTIDGTDTLPKVSDVESLHNETTSVSKSFAKTPSKISNRRSTNYEIEKTSNETENVNYEDLQNTTSTTSVFTSLPKTPAKLSNRRSTIEIEKTLNKTETLPTVCDEESIQNKTSTISVSTPFPKTPAKLSNRRSTFEIEKTLNETKTLPTFCDEESIQNKTSTISVSTSFPETPAKLSNRRSTIEIEKTLNKTETLPTVCDEESIQNTTSTILVSTSFPKTPAKLSNRRSTFEIEKTLNKTETLPTVCDEESIQNKTPMSKYYTETPAKHSNRRSTYDIEQTFDKTDILSMVCDEENFHNKTATTSVSTSLFKTPARITNRRSTYELEKSINNVNMLKSSCNEESLQDNAVTSSLSTPYFKTPAKISNRRSTFELEECTNNVNLLKTVCDEFGTPQQFSNMQFKRKYGASTPHPKKKDSSSLRSDKSQSNETNCKQHHSSDGDENEIILEKKRISSMVRLKKRRSNSEPHIDASLNEFLFNEKMSEDNFGKNITKRKKVTFKTVAIESPKVFLPDTPDKQSKTPRKKLSTSLPSLFRKSSQPSSTSTPKHNVKNSFALDKSKEKGKQIFKTKMPNFAAIHNKMLNKMEDIKEYSERKAERTKLLLSGHKPPEKNQENESPLKTKSKKQLPFSQKSQNELKGDDNSKIQIKGKFNQSTPSLKLGSVNSSTDGSKIHDKKPKIMTKFGFKITGPSKIPTREEQKKAVGRKTRVVTNTLEERRSHVQGVRSNRRFDLLMKMRQNKS